MFVNAKDLPITEKLVQKRGTVLKTHIGGVIFKVKRTSPLPNAFGKRDIFGRKVDRGFFELRFLGLDDNGKGMFRITDIETTSNETTMSRTPITYTTGNTRATYNPYTNTATASGSAISFGSPQGSTEVLPPNTTEFQLDPSLVSDLEFGEVKLTIQDISPVSISYVLN
tara:strand:+ start:8544 stop:9050 length:507 start_codon:yes stop_codon:yes gene_type:complete